MTTKRANVKPVAVPEGFYVGSKVWELQPDAKYAENPPDDWEDCGCCGGTHPPAFTGDCRDDIDRWPSDKCIAALTGESE